MATGINIPWQKIAKDCGVRITRRGIEGGSVQVARPTQPEKADVYDWKRDEYVTASEYARRYDK